MAYLEPEESPTRPLTDLVPGTTPAPGSLYAQTAPYQEPGITSPQRPPNQSWQGPAAANAPNTSRRAPRLIQRNGQWILQEHDNERVVAPEQVGNAQSYVDDFWSRNPTGFIQPGSPGYVAGQAMRNEDYPARAATGGTTPPTTGGTPPPPGTPAWLANATAATSRFPGGSSYNFGGFNLARDQDVTRSAKDATAYGALLGERAGAGNMWHTKEGAAQFATLYLKPYLESQGFTVRGINGDQINIVTREDREAGNTEGSWFDFVVNAGGENPMLAWQIQSGTGAQGGGNPGGGGGTTGTTGGGGGQNYQAIFQNLVGSRPPSVANLVALEPQLIANGMSLVWNANHTAADVKLPNGQIIDVLANATATSGPTGWQWLEPTYNNNGLRFGMGVEPPTTGAARATSAATAGGIDPYAYQRLAGTAPPSLADLVA